MTEWESKADALFAAAAVVDIQRTEQRIWYYCIASGSQLVTLVQLATPGIRPLQVSPPTSVAEKDWHLQRLQATAAESPSAEAGGLSRR